MAREAGHRFFLRAGAPSGAVSWGDAIHLSWLPEASSCPGEGLGGGGGREHPDQRGATARSGGDLGVA